MQGSARIGGTVSLLTAVLAFQLAGCADTQIGPPEVSALSIRVTVSGVDTDDGLQISLDGAVPQVVSPIWGLVLRSIASGAHTITVSALGKNCTLDGPNPLVVNVVPGGVGNVDFRVTCTATKGVIAVHATVSGSLWPTWLRLQVDAAPPEWIRANQKTFVGSFAGGAHVVRLVAVPSSCSLVGDDSIAVSIKTGGITRDTVLANFDLNCDPEVPVPYGSGDSAVIAFQRGDDIAVVREDGSNAQLLIPGATPSWSPDGEFLAFQRRRCVSEWGCTGDLWMIRSDGSGVRPITTSEGFDDSDPAVSPDGRSVAFIRFWNGPDESYLMVSDLGSTSPVVLSIWNPFSTPTWSPDGSQIAFTCQGPPLTWELDICRVATAGGCASYFVNVCTEPPPVEHLTSTRFVESEPAWSPDGARIAFTLGCSAAACPPGVVGPESYIALLDPVTGSVTPVVPGHRPAWSPDGKRIVFAGNATNPGLNVINLDGTGLRRLTDDARDTAPSWR